ncbi:MAG: hypothetical protein CGW95_16385 [Phenylobacterium zucineum]|nr:MAG: hypothetical protein CGW95_16385 [Phenylobacterium zucineum]
MSFDWKTLLPVIGAAVTGNVPGAILAASTAISDVLGVKVDPTPSAIDTALKTATPEQVIALQKLEADLKIRFKEIEVDELKAQLADVQDARKFNANTHGILYLGYLINAASYACVFAILYGCFKVLTGGSMQGVDPGLAATVGTVVGAVVQWLMSNAAQANSFFYGSSPGSRQVATDLAKSVGDATARIK